MTENLNTCATCDLSVSRRKSTALRFTCAGFFCCNAYCTRSSCCKYKFVVIVWSIRSRCNPIVIHLVTCLLTQTINLRRLLWVSLDLWATISWMITICETLRSIIQDLFFVSGKHLIEYRCGKVANDIQAASCCFHYHYLHYG